MIRPAAVAGQFYPAEPARLRAEVDRLLDPRQPKERVLGILCPHAGYPYSGRTAGMVFSRVEIPPRLVLLGVNHHGIGSPFALEARGRWETPLGTVDIDEELAAKLLAASRYLRHDPAAHAHEHSLEVELPFIQRLRPDARIVPIVFGSHDLRKLDAVGEAIATVLRGEDEPVLLLSSSDLNHYEDQATADRKDQLAIQAMRELDAEGLMRVCEAEQITMCGVAPTCVLLRAVRELGATRAELVDHRTSGDVTGDYRSVVGYAAMTFQ